MTSSQKALGVAVVLAIVVLVVVFGWEPQTVSFNSKGFSDTLQKLLGVALIALIIERALEVLLTTWRGGEADRRKDDVQQAREMLAQPKLAANAAKKLTNAQANLTAHSNQTRNKSFLFGTLIGIGVSLLGVRALETVLEYQSLKAGAPGQQNALVIVDILLTGLLIGGGADGIHKIVGTFTTYLDETSKKLKKGKP